jgi:hypothetical protein
MPLADARPRRYLPHGQGLPREPAVPDSWQPACGHDDRDIVLRPAPRATLNPLLLLSAFAGALLLPSAVSQPRAQQGLPSIQKVPHLFIETEVLGVRGGVTRSLGKGSIEASSGRPGTLTISFDLGPVSSDHPTSIEIEVTQGGAAEPKIGLTVVTTVTVASRAGEISRIRRERVAEVEEGRSFFHQAYENATQGTSVLLTMTPESRVIPQVVKPSLSAPIIFNVSLSSITSRGEVALETNVLRTLENSPVSYAFRVATARSPVEAVPVPNAQAPGESASAPASEPSAAPAAAGSSPSAAAAASGAKPDKGKKTKTKKMSRKERERAALEQFQRSRDAGASTASGSQAEAVPATGAGVAVEPAASAPAGTVSSVPGSVPGSVPAPAADAGSSPGGPEPSTPPAQESPGGAPPGATGSTAEAASTAPSALAEAASTALAGAPSTALAGAPTTADELELTLLPHRVESGILMVEASLRGRAPGAGGSQRATLVQRTQAITSNGSFDIMVSGMGPSGAGSYRFSVQARF